MVKVHLSPDQLRLLAQQEADNRELRAALAALKQQHAEACERLFALSQAHAGLYLSFTQIASAHATRDRVARDAMLDALADNWLAIQSRETVH